LKISCRNTGRQFGMLYNYIKVLLNFFKPKAAQTGEVIQMMRSINQQSHAFTRELHSNLLNSKKDMEFLMPGLKDPVITKPKDDNAEFNEHKCKFNFINLSNLHIAKITGAMILEVAIFERRNIVNKKKNDTINNNSFYS